MKTLFLLQLFISIFFTATHDVVAHPAIARQLFNVTNSGNFTSGAPYPNQPPKDLAAGEDRAKISPVTAGVGDSAGVVDNGESAAAPGAGMSPAVSGTGNSPPAPGFKDSPATPGAGSSPAVPGTVNSPLVPGTGGSLAAPGVGNSPAALGEADIAAKVAAGLAGTPGPSRRPTPIAARVD